MKIRKGFVSNSSSTSFIITNKTNNDLTLVDFVKENHQLLYDFIQEYTYSQSEEDIFTIEKMIQCANNRNEKFQANTDTESIYGDEDGDILGQVYDYILRDGGESENFIWRFNEYHR